MVAKGHHRWQNRAQPDFGSCKCTSPQGSKKGREAKYGFLRASAARSAGHFRVTKIELKRTSPQGWSGPQMQLGCEAPKLPRVDGRSPAVSTVEATPGRFEARRASNRPMVAGGHHRWKFRAQPEIWLVQVHEPEGLEMGLPAHKYLPPGSCGAKRRSLPRHQK